MNKKEFLEKLYENRNDFEVFRLTKKNGKASAEWIKWLKYSEARKSEKLLDEINQRSIFQAEIVLDLEDAKELDDVKWKLNEENLSYEVWATQSRGYHLHLWFKDLVTLNSDNREFAKEQFIKHFGCDTAKKSERNVIALEYADHWKSGKPKKLIEKPGLINLWIDAPESEWNFLPEFINDALKKKKKVSFQSSPVNYSNFLQDPFLKAALREKLPEGERNKVLFKNLAIGLWNSGLSDAERDAYIEEIGRVQGENTGSITGWIDKARKGELTKVNRAELQQWAIRNNLQIRYRKESLKEYEDFASELIIKPWIYEQVTDYNSKSTKFCGYNMETEEVKFVDEVKESRGDELITWKPIQYLCSMDKTGLNAGIILPEKPMDYGSTHDLFLKIKNFIHKYVDLSDEELLFSSWYPFLTYMRDKLYTYVFLRAMGASGKGKSRHSTVVGILCNKAMEFNANTSEAPVFRIMDQWWVTPIIHEFNPQKSSADNPWMQMLNGAFERRTGIILRCEGDDNTPTAYRAYGPYILNTRYHFTDDATESRCITVNMRETTREDIPDELLNDFYAEAMEIKNMLLKWRFDNWAEVDPHQGNKIELKGLTRRLRQVSRSFFTIICNDEKAVEAFKEYLYAYEKELIEQKSLSKEGIVVNALYRVVQDSNFNYATVARICEKLMDEFGWKNATPQTVGRMLSVVNIKTKRERSGSGYETFIDWKNSNWEKQFEAFVPDYSKLDGEPDMQKKLDYDEIKESPKITVKKDSRNQDSLQKIKQLFGDEEVLTYDDLHSKMAKAGFPLESLNDFMNEFIKQGYIAEAKKGHYILIE